MKKLLFIVLLASPCLAGGPKYNYSDPHLNDELNNIYKDGSFPNIVNGRASTMTATYLNVSTVSVKQITFSDGTNQTSGIGRILQIKTLQTTSATAGTSSTFFAITPITNSITMSKSTNKIRVSLSGDLFCQNVGLTEGYLTIKRDSTNLGDATVGLADVGTNNSSAAFKLGANVGISIYDSPGDTSSHTYQAFVRSSDNTTSCQFPGLTQASLTLEEISQ